MTRLAIILAAALTLGACSTMPGGDPAAQLPQHLDNLQYCKRTYTASIGGLGVPGGSLHIDCDPAPRPPAQ